MALNKTFVLRNPTVEAACLAFIKANGGAMAAAGTPLAVTIAEAKAKRNHEQNARYHALVNDIAQGAWLGGQKFGAETWRLYLKAMFIGTEEFTLPDGKIMEVPLSTTELGIGAFSDFLTQIEEYAVNVLGIELPNK